MAALFDFNEYALAAQSVPIEHQWSPRAAAHRDVVILHAIQAAGTALYQQPDDGYYDASPPGPVDPRPERFKMILSPK